MSEADSQALASQKYPDEYLTEIQNHIATATEINAESDDQLIKSGVDHHQRHFCDMNDCYIQEFDKLISELKIKTKITKKRTLLR